MNVETDEKIFTKSFFLIFATLLFTALVMYALMSTVTEYATSMGSSATIAGLVSGIYIFGGLYSRHPAIITQAELGRITGVNGPTKGKLLKSNGEVPKRVVMIQCVGSRDEKPDGHKYCSKICCSVACKNANIIKHKYPDTDVVICYTDVRTPGMFEKYYKHTQSNEVRFIRGRPGEVAIKNDNLLVRVENTINGEFEEIEAETWLCFQLQWSLPKVQKKLQKS